MTEGGHHAPEERCAKRARTAQKCGQLLYHELDAAHIFEAIIGAACEGGASWNRKLRRGTAPESQVMGIITSEDITEGEELCRIPARLHISRKNVRECVSNVFEACDQRLPSSDEDRRAEAAHMLAIALLLLERHGVHRGSGQVNELQQSDIAGKGASPKVWQYCADLLLALDVDFHPYCKFAFHAESLRAAIAPSKEYEHVAGLVGYVFTVYDCICDKVGSEILPPTFSKEAFLKAWVCLLSRSIQTPHGSALIPAVDMFNHSSEPDAILDWDEAQDSLVVTAVSSVGRGREVCIAYGSLSNPLLWRTYGFTLPTPAAPRHSCTFSAEELQQVCSENGVGQELADSLAELPDLHADSAFLDNTVALLIQTVSEYAAAIAGLSAAGFLRLLMQRRLSLYSAGTSEDLEVAVGIVCDSFRVHASERLCLQAHLEALDVAQGFLAEDKARFNESVELRADLKALAAAGLLATEVLPAEPCEVRGDA
eukprot:TRINITY_DN38199_c0_g1_i1.p1 TRINITY_DN38199_c0_g1~~TRINITY_DN38199_c0_g1_i1.p1  ORF type:complete len:484 (+),score=71.03 TRINITY_DN38199_c0_g1_i1:168-1619(+)